MALVSTEGRLGVGCECWSLKWEIPVPANTRGLREGDSLWSDHLWILKIERLVSSPGQRAHLVQWDRHTGAMVTLWRGRDSVGDGPSPPTHPHQRVLELAGERPVDAVALVGGQERQTMRRGPT